MSDTIIAEPPQWHINAASHQGPRVENQDNYLIIHPNGHYQYLYNETLKKGYLSDWPVDHVRLVVADGMGGHNNGRQASESVIKALLKLDFQAEEDQLRKAILGIHNQLFEQFHQGAKTPGSTLVIAEITPDGQALIANIGDSRAYLCQAGAWSLVTQDHTVTEFMYRDDEIDKARYDQQSHRNTNQIVQAMIFGSVGILANKEGIKTNQHVQGLRIDQQDIIRLNIATGDVLMLASDGLWSGVQHYQPDAISGEVDDYVQQQLSLALERTRDNVTLCCYQP
ncbi:MAG: protein serine/threonine phosphatase 2C family protein [Cocleimonas sp.]|nr:protein serine/threonine phosphatase 2C family protein [Cocleimonas sp.]